MLLHMQKYDYIIQYKPGKEIVLANCLSHCPFHKQSLPIPIAQNVQYIQLSNAKLDIEVPWSVTQCIVPSIASPLEVGPITGSKSSRSPDTSGEPRTNCLLNPAYSSRGHWSASLWSYSTIPLQTCMEHIKGSIGCKHRQGNILAQHRCQHSSLCLPVHHLHLAQSLSPCTAYAT